jgi:hypothetical protein
MTCCVYTVRSWSFAISSQTDSGMIAPQPGSGQPPRKCTSLPNSARRADRCPRQQSVHMSWSQPAESSFQRGTSDMQAGHISSASSSWAAEEAAAGESGWVTASE